MKKFLAILREQNQRWQRENKKEIIQQEKEKKEEKKRKREEKKRLQQKKQLEKKQQEEKRLEKERLQEEERLAKEEKAVATEPSGGGSLTGKITRLKRLYKNGTLTKAEFEKAKNNLLK